MAGWCFLVAILGLLDRRRGRATGGPPQRSYLTAAAHPLYLLHQPILVAVAYGVVRWDAPIPVKYAVIVVVLLTLTVAGYELLVRRTRVTRLLFGMRGLTVPRAIAVGPAPIP